MNIVSHFNANELISEIKSEFSSFKVDDILLKNAIYFELKSFRDVICVPIWEFAHINGGFAELPVGFQSVIDAWIVTPNKVYSHSVDKETILKTRVYTQQMGVFEAIETTCCEKSEHLCQDTCKCADDFIVEKSLISKTPVYFTYKSPRKLSIVDYSFDKISGNRKRESLQASIYGDRLYVDFDKATVVLNYNGIPYDEDGFVLIPNTYDDSVRKFMLTALHRAMYKSPKMLAQEGFVNIFNALAPSIEQDYYFEKRKVHGELTRLNKSQIMEFVAQRSRKLDKYFHNYKFI